MGQAGSYDESVRRSGSPGASLRSIYLRDASLLNWLINRTNSYQDLALTHIPIAELYDTADKLEASNTPLACYEDALAEALVKWFKPAFFEWIDPIKCKTCGKGMKLREVQGPGNDEERTGGAVRVEIHVCEDDSCGGVDRFPRYKWVLHTIGSFV